MKRRDIGSLEAVNEGRGERGESGREGERGRGEEREGRLCNYYSSLRRRRSSYVTDEGKRCCLRLKLEPEEHERILRDLPEIITIIELIQFTV